MSLLNFDITNVNYAMLGIFAVLSFASLIVFILTKKNPQKNYRELPQYASGWDAAMMPFALNDSTRFISPTKTPEFLAAGLPVVSTAIEDVMTPYGDESLVYIAHSAEEFADSLSNALKDRKNIKWQLKVDSFLADISWDSTWKNMARLEQQIGIEVDRSEHKVHPSPDYRPIYTTTLS